MGIDLHKKYPNHKWYDKTTVEKTCSLTETKKQTSKYTCSPEEGISGEILKSSQRPDQLPQGRFGVGDVDLNPMSGNMPGIGGMHPGGGMFVGPEHPMFNQPGGIGGYGGRMPGGVGGIPGGVGGMPGGFGFPGHPGGARFDPVGPFGPMGPGAGVRPSRGGRGRGGMPFR